MRGSHTSSLQSSLSVLLFLGCLTLLLCHVSSFSAVRTVTTTRPLNGLPLSALSLGHQLPRNCKKEHLFQLGQRRRLVGTSLRSLESSNDATSSKEVPLLDVMVCGAGPAGLLIASSLAREGCKVGIVDPALENPWPNNYGVWMDEADEHGYADCVDAVWKEVGIIFDEKTPELCLNRPYGRVDRIKLKGRLIQECQQHGVFMECAKATDVIHFDDKPSKVKLATRPSSDGQQKTDEVEALLVVDATGFSRSFVKHAEKFDPGYQNTYGALLEVEDLGPYAMDRMVLMDYGSNHLPDSMQPSNDRFPSFVYAMPLGPKKLFLEETVLVSRPACPSRDLEARLYERMKALNITVVQILEDERASIPMGGMDPIIPQRTVGFGSTSSLIHPASGYMVARAMEIAPRVAQAIAPAVLNVRKQYDNKNVLNAADLDQLSKIGWDSVWPAEERRQRDFMHFGFELLCRLNPQELRDFFTGFFRLPDALWEHFLSWRLSGIGHVVMGLIVWSQCIPRRFMPSMLWNSLPFLFNRLILPFASRGSLSSDTTDSLYWDAPSYGVEKAKWEPKSYYPYLKELSARDYDTNATDVTTMGASDEQASKPTEVGASS